jgi:hypothetical protein
VQRKRPTVHDLNALGVHFYSVEAYDLAIVQLEQATSLAPDVAAIHFNLGGAYYGKGRIEPPSRRSRPSAASSDRSTAMTPLPQGHEDGQLSACDEPRRARTRPCGRTWITVGGFEGDYGI